MPIMDAHTICLPRERCEIEVDNWRRQLDSEIDRASRREWLSERSLARIAMVATELAHFGACIQMYNDQAKVLREVLNQEAV